MATLREMITRVGFEVNRGQAAQAENQINRLKQRLNGLAFAAKAFLGGVVLRRGMQILTGEFVKEADAIAKFSKATGLASGFVQRFAHAMELGGASTEESQKGIRRYLKTVNDAKRGLKTAKQAFSEIGIDPNTITADREGLLKVSDALANMSDKGKRAAAVQDLFGGRVALKLVPGLEVGRKKLAEYLDEADKLGKVIGPKGLAIAEKYSDEMMRAKSVFKGLRNQIAIKLLPAITDAAQRFHMWARQSGNLQRMLKWLKIAAIGTAAALALLASAKLVTAFSQIIGAIGAATMAIRRLGWAGMWAQAKLLLIPAAIAALVLILVDLWYFAQGKDSLIGRILGKSELADKLRKALKSFGREAMAIWKDLKPAMLEVWKEMKPALAEFWTAIKPLIPYLITLWVWSVQASAETIKLISAQIRWVLKVGRILFSFLKKVAGHLKAAFATPLAGIASGIMGLIGKAIKLVNKLREAAGLSGKSDLEKAIREGGKTGRKEGYTKALSEAGPISLRGLKVTPLTHTDNRRLSVNMGGVHIQGTNASPAEIEEAVRRGAKKVLQEEIVNSYRNRAPVTP